MTVDVYSSFQLTVNESEYFANNLRFVKYSMKRNLRKLRKSPEKYR
jgi:hypothetical protein